METSYGSAEPWWSELPATAPAAVLNLDEATDSTVVWQGGATRPNERIRAFTPKLAAFFNGGVQVSLPSSSGSLAVAVGGRRFGRSLILKGENSSQ